MRQSTTRLYNWAMEKANSQKAPFWIAFLFVLELVLFIPLDAILIFFCLQNRKNIFLYVGIAAVASTLSGLVGYLLGHFLWDLIGSYIVPHFISASFFNKLSFQFQVYEVWAVFFASLIPFPLKALSLTAGVFHLGVIPFATFMLLARLLRFSLVGVAMSIWGENVKSFVDKHFHRIIVVIGAKVAMAFLFFWAIAR